MRKEQDERQETRMKDKRQGTRDKEQETRDKRQETRDKDEGEGRREGGKREGREGSPPFFAAPRGL